jgi:hypothetical protein
MVLAAKQVRNWECNTLSLHITAVQQLSATNAVGNVDIGHLGRA